MYSTFHGNSGNSVAGYCIGCVAYANTATPYINGAYGSFYVNSIAYGKTGATTDGFALSTPSISYVMMYVNDIAESNGRDGFRGPSSPPNPIGRGLINCSTYGNGTAAVEYITSQQLLNTVATSGSVFVDPATQDFRLNNTAGAGALLRAAGYSATWPATSMSMVNALDIGAVQMAQAATTGGGYAYVQ